jgi:hypothetical protein
MWARQDLNPEALLRKKFTSGKENDCKRCKEMG